MLVLEALTNFLFLEIGPITPTSCPLNFVSVKATGSFKASYFFLSFQTSKSSSLLVTIIDSILVRFFQSPVKGQA